MNAFNGIANNIIKADTAVVKEVNAVKEFLVPHFSFKTFRLAISLSLLSMVSLLPIKTFFSPLQNIYHECCVKSSNHRKCSYFIINKWYLIVMKDASGGFLLTIMSHINKRQTFYFWEKITKLFTSLLFITGTQLI